MKHKSSFTDIYGSCLFSALLLVIVLFYAGCSTTEHDRFFSDKIIGKKPLPITIRFLGQWKNEGLRELWVRDFCREYEFTHQEIKIDLEFPEDIYYTREDPLSNSKFVASIVKEKNPAWDVIRLNNEYTQIDFISKDLQWAKKGLVDFSNIEEFKKNTLSYLDSDSVRELWHGIIPGPFIEGVNWALWCNKAVAKKIGITVKQFGMTFDDFLGYMKAANEYNKSHKDYIIPLFEANDWKTTYAVAFQLYASELANQQDFFTDAVSEKKFKAWGKTLHALQQLSIYKPLSDRCDTLHWEVGKNLILEDKCLFFSNGSWMYNIWLKYNPEKMNDIMPTEYPVFKPTNLYIGAYQIMWGVLKNAPHREDAIKFLLAWTTPSVTEQWERYTKCSYGSKSNFSTVFFGKDQFSIFTNYIDHKYRANKYFWDANSKYIVGYSKRTIPFYSKEVLQGTITADDAILRMKKEAGR